MFDISPLDDGSVRVYSLPTIAVTKAIRGLGDEISSICWTTPFSSDNGGKVWVASGQKVFMNHADSIELLYFLHSDTGFPLRDWKIEVNLHISRRFAPS